MRNALSSIADCTTTSTYCIIMILYQLDKIMIVHKNCFEKFVIHGHGDW